MKRIPEVYDPKFWCEACESHHVGKCAKTPSAAALKIAQNIAKRGRSRCETQKTYAENLAAIIDAGLAEVRESLNRIAELRGEKGEILYEGACQQIAKAALAKLV